MVKNLVVGKNTNMEKIIYINDELCLKKEWKRGNESRE